MASLQCNFAKKSHINISVGVSTCENICALDRCSITEEEQLRRVEARSRQRCRLVVLVLVRRMLVLTSALFSSRNNVSSAGARMLSGMWFDG
jgi:hypothetical protein